MNTSLYNASEKDGKEISRILESSAGNGNIDLSYTRRPDAYESYMKEPGEARVFVSKKDGKAICTCAELIRNVYIGKEKSKAAYICGLKKDPEYKKEFGFGGGAIRNIQRDDIDYYFCCVVSDNEDTQKKFEKSMGLLSIKRMCSYKTYIINPNVKIKAQKHSYNFRRAKKEDMPKLLEFINKEGKKKDLFPVIDSLEEFYNLHPEDFCILFDGDEIIAAGAIWNTTNYKQYTVIRYNKLMKFARVFNPIISALGYVKLPKENEPIRFPMLSFLTFKDENEEDYFIFLNEIRKEISKEYNIFAFGVPDGHFARNRLDKIPNVSFESIIYELKFPWSNQKYKNIDMSNLSTESGLL